MAEKSPRVVYERDSMEKFGDDLTEEVLQYLCFGDKLKFECLSKQWQRLVFNKEMEIDTINIRLSVRKDFIELKNSFIQIFQTEKYRLERNHLISVVKKCPNISRVRLQCMSYKDLDVITNYCRRVTKLTLSQPCDEQTIMSFATKHGMWLQEFGIDLVMFEFPDYMKKFLRMCPNIKKINIDRDLEHNLDIIYESESLKKLEVIKGLRVDRKDPKGLDILVRKYGTSLKAIEISFIEMSSDELKSCFAHISRFESLESLELKFNYDLGEPIDECLKLFAHKCTKLRELRISNNSGLISNSIFFALSELRSLERLEVLIFNRNRVEGSVECLKHMTRLKHLSISPIGQKLDFLANIQTHLPNIRYLKIFIRNYDYTSLKPFLESLQTMKCIERVVVNKEWKFYYNKNRSESKPRVLLQ